MYWTVFRFQTMLCAKSSEQIVLPPRGRKYSLGDERTLRATPQPGRGVLGAAGFFRQLYPARMVWLWGRLGVRLHPEDRPAAGNCIQDRGLEFREEQKL